MVVSKKCCLGEMVVVVVVVALGTADAKWCPDGNARQTGMRAFGLGLLPASVSALSVVSCLAGAEIALGVYGRRLQACIILGVMLLLLATMKEKRQETSRARRDSSTSNTSH